MSRFDITKHKLEKAWSQTERNRISLIVNNEILSSNHRVIQDGNEKQNSLNTIIDLSSDWLIMDKFVDGDDFTLYKSWQLVFPYIRPIISTFLNYKIVYKIGEDLNEEIKLTSRDFQSFNIILLSNWQEVDIGLQTLSKMIFNACINIDDSRLNQELKANTDLIKVKLIATLVNPMEYL